MKKTFQIIGLISLTLFSFFITEKTITVVNNLDEIMIQIKQEKDKYKSNTIDANIDGNTIIPGINGRKVNIKKSYKNMKMNGYYSDKLFIYDYTKPKISITDNLDKYIIKGNPKKRMVSLIFILNNDEDITDILTILNNYNVEATFFVSYTWYSNNTDLIKEITSNNHIIAPLFDDYNDANYETMDMVIRRVNKQSVNFCYSKEENLSNLEICKLRGSYTIRPVLISNRTPLLDLKNNIESGSLLSFNINSELKKELSTIIIYIKKKGYELTNLQTHLLE